MVFRDKRFGELLKDLAKNVKADVRNLSMVIEHSDKKHPVLKIGSSRSKQRPKSHAQISQYVIDKGYNYIQVSDKAQKTIVDLLRKTLLNNLEKSINSK